MLVTRAEAQLILNNLQNGTVPLEFAHIYNVDREEQIAQLCCEIGDPALGRHRLKFVNGEYGQGKTQMLGVVRQWAIQNGYAASHVVLRSRGTSLADLRSVYGAILRNLWRPERNRSAVQAVLEVVFSRYMEWRAPIVSRRLPCPLYGHMSMLFCHHCYEEGNVERQYLPGFEELEPTFRRAVSMYRRAAEGDAPDNWTKEQVVRFLEDDLGYRRGLNFIGTWLPLSAEEILDGLGQITKIFRLSGLKGLVIALDEAEAIPSIGGAGVSSGYANLGALIEAAQQVREIYFIYATTPTFFDDVRRHAQAIARRVSTETRMNLAPLTENDLVTLATRVAGLVALASEGAGCEARVVQVGREIAARQGARSVRDFLTALFATANVS